jgi:hypothetical protein
MSLNVHPMSYSNPEIVNQRTGVTETCRPLYTYWLPAAAKKICRPIPKLEAYTFSNHINHYFGSPIGPKLIFWQI